MRTWVQEHTPDLVLVDYNMPALRGDQLIEINRRTGLTVPMVLYTNATSSEMAMVANKCGAIGYILKGVPWEALLEQIERVFSRISIANRVTPRSPG
jgi:DNA-binding NarL/FixJ family response regulator